ncbi:hypothetical protein CYMTET_44779 [Cymbomonas tetramitiformis]|uniref:ATP-dependent (S)-NAD(P)H-hydrate dehydratase n=1 Tax=Cymbomonas tetramitiformis TaxID=36881 RepID=A0AAE0BZJ2_9CHLO|nr:hypothetical protein CYMTET_44779 [Cymbomonas tetramitiformis]
MEANNEVWNERVRAVVPKLDPTKYKGQAGKIGVVGGCQEYTGAPYFAAISALRVGADLAHVFCSRGAGPVIKGYSPELIVHPYLPEDSEDTYVPSQEAAVAAVEKWLSRLDCLVVGPGLGRDPLLLDSVEEIIRRAKRLNLPLVIDADGLFLVNRNPDLIRDYPLAILTPNVNEYHRLPKALGVESEFASAVTEEAKLALLSQALGGLTILKKGGEDLISNGKTSVCVSGGGSLRRCGGQGDVLAGSIAVFMAWAVKAEAEGKLPMDTCEGACFGMVAAYGGCCLLREVASVTFAEKRRSMLASDLIPHLGECMESMHPCQLGSQL